MGDQVVGEAAGDGAGQGVESRWCVVVHSSLGSPQTIRLLQYPVRGTLVEELRENRSQKITLVEEVILFARSD